MRRNSLLSYFIICSLLVMGCAPAEQEEPTATAAGDNPFLKDFANHAKEDTEYQNPDGIEVEVDLEGDVEGSKYLLSSGPAALGQFALTYLRKRGQFYLESLAEDMTSRERVEWLVDGSWITAAQAESVSPEKLRRFRVRGVNAVLLNQAAAGVSEGTQFTAKVPINPFNVKEKLSDTCADPDGHITLSQSVYWYFWNPDKSSCQADLQDMTITVSKMFSSAMDVYPEYDQLVADKKITAVLLYGQVGDGPPETDMNVYTMKRIANWLLQAGFQEVIPAPLGRRFSKQLGEVTMEIDLYSPVEFAGLGDYGNLANFQKAISEHEIVAYHGHSMLGASDFWARPSYPDFYQIFFYGGCLGYEYYVNPIYKGKGNSWDKLDVVSSVIEVSASYSHFSAHVLAKIAYAVENNYQVTWRTLLGEIRRIVYDSSFGASGVRENSFRP